MLIVQVHVNVKPDMTDQFIEATKRNAAKSIYEPGIMRFDFMQSEEDKNRFVLVEVYKDKDAPARHKETQHYKEWREIAESMMAEPRTSIKYENIFPDDNGW